MDNCTHLKKEKLKITVIQKYKNILTNKISFINYLQLHVLKIRNDS